MTGLNCDNLVISRFLHRIITVSLVFFIFSSLGPIYNLTEGSFSYEEVNFVDFSNQKQDQDGILNDVITEDGFLLKPALNSVEGDRSTANEIFSYEVEPGDTLSSLAQRFGVKKETLIMENDLWNANRLRSGMTIRILPVDGISYAIKKGDTVEKIAKKYKVKAEDIIRQNQLNKEAILTAGSALIIPGAKKIVEKPKPSTNHSNGGNHRPTYGNNAPSRPGVYNVGASTGRLIWPALANAKLTQGYHGGHYAIDIANRAKGPIFAAAAGKIIKASYGWNGGYGNVIIIDHGGGMQTLYGHNEKLYVTVGQHVEQGQTISWMGNSGRVYGPTGIHVHFEVRINGVKYNPMNFF